MGRFEHRECPLVGYGTSAGVGVGDENSKKALAESRLNYVRLTVSVGLYGRYRRRACVEVQSRLPIQTLTHVGPKLVDT